jgi:hypothetical protein
MTFRARDDALPLYVKEQGAMLGKTRHPLDPPWSDRLLAQDSTSGRRSTSLAQYGDATGLEM